MTEIEATFVSVDIETAGPNPNDTSLLSVGACVLADLDRVFYVELQPVNRPTVPEAMAIHGMSLDRLVSKGQPSAEAMRRFAACLAGIIVDSRAPSRNRPACRRSGYALTNDGNRSCPA